MKYLTLKLSLLLVLVNLSFSVFAGNYGSIYLANGNTDIISGTLTAGNWQTVEGMGAMEMENWTFNSTSNHLKSNLSGNFFIRYAISFSASEGVWDIGVFKNGVLQTDLSNRRKISDVGSADVGNISSSGFISFNSNDSICIKVKSDIDAIEFIPVDVQLIAVEMMGSADPYYGELKITGNNISQTLSLDNTWYHLTQTSAGDLSNFSYSSDVLTAGTGASGKYLAVISASFNGTGPTNYELGLSLNNNDPDKILFKRLISGSSDYGNAVACGIIQVTDGDNIRVKARCNNSSSNLKVEYMNLVLIPLNGSSGSSCGSMVISSNSNFNDITNGWTEEDNFTAAAFSNIDWSLSHNVSLVPGPLVTGTYIVNISVAITYADVNDINNFIYPELAVFINSTIQDNLYMIRKLQKKDNEDYGAASASGIVTITGVNDTITLRLSSSTGRDYKVLDANLNLFRIDNTVLLPLSLLEFNASLVDEGIMVNWITASEKNLLGYRLERFVAHKDEWVKVISYEEDLNLLANNQYENRNYQFLDTEVPDESEVVYRLWAVENDMKEELLKIVSLQLDHYVDVKLYPVPARDYLYVNGFKENNICFDIYNLNGSKIKSGVLNNNSIDITDIDEGTYFIIFNGKYRAVQKRFMVYRR